MPARFVFFTSMVYVLPAAEMPYAIMTLLICFCMSCRTIGCALAWKKCS